MAVMPRDPAALPRAFLSAFGGSWAALAQPTPARQPPLPGPTTLRFERADGRPVEAYSFVVRGLRPVHHVAAFGDAYETAVPGLASYEVEFETEMGSIVGDVMDFLGESLRCEFTCGETSVAIGMVVQAVDVVAPLHGIVTARVRCISSGPAVVRQPDAGPPAAERPGRRAISL